MRLVKRAGRKARVGGMVDALNGTVSGDARVRARLMMACAFLLLATMLVCVPQAHALTYKYVAHQSNVGNPDVTDNSLEAFEYAAANAPTLYGIETDIFRTDQGDYICCHPDGSGNYTWGGETLADKSLDEIKSLTRNGCHIATMREYLQICKDGGKWAYIQICENCGADYCLEDMLDMVADADMLDQCVFTASRSSVTSLGRVKAIARERYGQDVLASSGSGSGNDYAGFDEALKGVEENGLDSIAVYGSRDNRMAYAYERLQGTEYRLRAGGGGVGEAKARSLIEQYDVTCVYTSGFNPASYTVSFVDANGEVIKTQVVGYRDAAAPPTDEELAGHIEAGFALSGWSEGFDEVTEDLTVRAVLEEADVHTIKYCALCLANAITSFEAIRRN